MTNAEAVNWLINITADIGKAEHSDLWHYEQALSEIREMLEGAQPETHDKHTEMHACDLIDRQAAIDWLTNEWDGMVTSVFDGIKNLPSEQPEPLKIHLDPELTKEEIERLMRIGDSPVILPDRQEITLESAIDYLHSIGWMQEHDELMYKQGYKHGKSKGIKRGMAIAKRKHEEEST